MSPSRFDSENEPEQPTSPSFTPSQRRASIEKLKQASRVKYSNIFALENKDAYDPSSVPVVERPSMNRPLSQTFTNNSFARFDSLKKENNSLRSPQRFGHKRTESETHVPLMSPTKYAASGPLPTSPEKQSSPSPTKSSLARTSQFGTSPQVSFDPENGTWSDDERVPTPRALGRLGKSVTFHAEPPVINEYEQQTPEPSVSAASDREGSWDSDDFDPDYSFERGSSAEQERDDSFDLDLENADKTPVVLPEDWSRMSPDEARTDLVNNEDDVFEGEATERLVIGQSDRVVSDGDNRPLPPLPGFMRRERRGSDSLFSAAERAAHSPHSLPSTPKGAVCSKEDILNMAARSSLTLQDRLQLMGVQEDRPSSKSSQETEHANPEEMTTTNLDTAATMDVHVAETEVEEDSVLGDMSTFVDAPPRISRESILRKVRNAKYEFEDFADELDVSEYRDAEESPGRPTIEELARMDPDQPVPSRENSRETSNTYDAAAAAVAAAYVEDYEEETVHIKAEPTEDDAIEMSAIPAALDPPARSPSRFGDYDRQSSVLRHNLRSGSEEDDDNDSASRYSSVEPDAESTMIHTTRHETVQHQDGTKETLEETMQLLSVKDYSEVNEPTKQGASSSGEFMGLPAYLSTDEWDFGMKEYITPSPPASSEELTKQKSFDVTEKMPELQPPIELQRSAEIEQPQHPYAAEVSPPATPESVIHRSGEVSPIEEHNGVPEESTKRESDPGIPERIASIKTGGKLKTRPSATPADFETMATQRRLVSAEHPVPAIPQPFQAEFEDASEGAKEDDRPESSQSHTSDAVQKKKSFKERRKSRKSGGRMDLDLGLDTSSFSICETDGLGLDQEFDRVIESQKVGASFPPPLHAYFDASAAQQQREQQERQLYIHHDTPSPYTPHIRSAGTDVSTRTQKGYLMRQNTKVVVASNRNFSGDSNDTTKSSVKDRDEPPMSPVADARPTSKGARGKDASPRKASEEQFMKTEPWNGKMRRKSIRNASAQKHAYRNEPAPPLPGQESAALGVVDEDYAAGSASLEEEVDEGVERGRLFVKVVGVKDLDLPMPRNDRIDFQLTLDNGLHCVTTTEMELGKSAPIGQEFELVVLNDLEFQLTLTTKLPPPPSTPTPAPASPTKSIRSQKSSGFSRFLTSPRKRAEKERLEREAAEAEQRRREDEIRRKRASQIPTSWDLLHELVNGSDGSFARAYVNLKSHEKVCFGRQLTVDVPLYNEWALEQDVQVVTSVRSKRGANAGPVRRPPYVVGKLELQLLYVPKPAAAVDDDMPKSMSSAVREMNRASEVKEVSHEGHLSQQGGDCVVSSLDPLLSSLFVV